MRAFVMCLAVALSFLIDTIILTRLDLFGVRPDLIMSLVVYQKPLPQVPLNVTDF